MRLKRNQNTLFTLGRHPVISMFFFVSHEYVRIHSTGQWSFPCTHLFGKHTKHTSLLSEIMNNIMQLTG